MRLYFAVRKVAAGEVEGADTGREHVDSTSCAYALLTCKQRAAETDRLIPRWAEGNPVVRYAAFVLADEEAA